MWCKLKFNNGSWAFGDFILTDSGWRNDGRSSIVWSGPKFPYQPCLVVRRRDFGSTAEVAYEYDSKYQGRLMEMFMANPAAQEEDYDYVIKD